MITTQWLEIGPAYGRDYKNAAAVKADWDAGKDFQMLSLVAGGQYCSKADFAPGTNVIVRYGKMMKMVTVKS